MEGPSLVILREELQPFLGGKVLTVTGNTKEAKCQLRGRKLDRIETWGKTLFLTFTSNRKSELPIVTKTHFLMFGSYTIDRPKKDRDPRLKLKFKNGTVYFYSCSFKFGAQEAWNALDQRIDLMSPKWSEKHVLRLMEKKENAFLCDLLLDQTIFAGSGNIVKNEVLFNIRRHPLTRLSDVEREDWPKLAWAVRLYCWNFYDWKKKFELRRHWQVYKKHKCPLCERALTKENDGKLQRRSHFCRTHQPLNAPTRNVDVFPVLPIKAPRGPKEARLDH